jgi:hypothetical protein
MSTAKGTPFDCGQKRGLNNINYFTGVSCIVSNTMEENGMTVMITER